jgi:hypothetical protein
MAVGYTVDRHSGRVTFHTPITTESDYELARQVKEEARRSRPMSHGDAEDILSALGRIEALLAKLIKDAE